ncbi:MAG: ceramidase, partial [Acidimicrobiia bacterium]|nr:ceramidase [Acidimicrobiia bacterium]
MPAADCERLLDGFLAQPVNAVSSLAFVLAGMSVFVRRRGASGRALVGAFSVTLIAVGIGSWAFHGPGGTTADWVHDASITALLVLIVSVELGYVAGWTDRQVVAGWTGTTTALWLVEWVWPSVGDTLNAPLALFAVLGVLAPQLGAGRSGEAQRPGTGVFVGLALLGVG